MKKNIVLSKKNYIVGFCVLLIGTLNAQLETSHWYFGHNLGIDFSSGTAVEDTNGRLETLEGCSSISDSNGNLLFYTDGDDSTFNRNHQPLLNGNNLFGNSSSSQSAIIVP